jgi:hypothetical protein
MSAWSRLFGRSKSSQPKSKPRLGLESLEAREVPAIVFVGGWGASAYQYATAEPEPPARPLPVLMVLADQQYFYYSTTGDTSGGKSALAAAPEPVAARLNGVSTAGYGFAFNATVDATVADDVMIDGRIITGENYDSATIASSGYIRVKKLNSG